MPTMIILLLVLASASPLLASRTLKQDTPQAANASTTQLPLIFLRPAWPASDAGELPLTYTDKGGRAQMDISTYTPQNKLTPNLTFKALGSFAVNNFRGVNGNLGWQNIYMAMAGTDGAVTYPVDYAEIWNDKGTGSAMDGAVWRASAPDGYVALGDLWNSGYGKPDLKSMYVVKKECVELCTQTPQLIYSDKGSWAPKDVTLYTVGVSSIGTPSPDNLGLCRAKPNYDAVNPKAPWNLCLRKECAKTVQLKDFELVSIEFDTSKIDPLKAKATTFKHQDLSNNSPGTLKTSVSGSKKSSKSVTMTFTGYGCHFNPCQKTSLSFDIPEVAKVSQEMQVTKGFTFAFGSTHSSTTVVEETLTCAHIPVTRHGGTMALHRETVEVTAPPFTHITVDMMLATVNDAEVPFIAQMSTTAYDWRDRTNAVKESAIVDILKASGFNGKVLGYDVTNSSLLIESPGVLKAAIATSIMVNMTCKPLPGHQEVCPSTIALSLPGRQPAVDLEAVRAPVAAQSEEEGIVYQVTLPAKLG